MIASCVLYGLKWHGRLVRMVKLILKVQLDVKEHEENKTSLIQSLASANSLASSCVEFSIGLSLTQYETGLLLELGHAHDMLV